MKIIIYISVFLLLVFVALRLEAGDGSQSKNPQITEPHEPQTIIFKIRPELAYLVNENRININSLQNAFAQLGGGSVLRKYPRHSSPAKKLEIDGLAAADLSLMYILRYRNNAINISKAIDILLQTKALEYAEPFYLRASCYVPNDPQVVNQYHLTNIKAFEAWDITKGDTLITIGIVDSGVQLNHPDLAKKVQFNRADTIDGQDNDNDGYIDNFYGWDMAGANFNLPIPDNNPTIFGANNTHGTHVAGIAAAHTDNDTGIAGVGFRTRFLPIKCGADNDTRSNGSGFIYDGFGGIVYAADHGCHIINCSWGGGGFSEYEQEIIRYATFTKNALVVAAAGNNNSESDFFPASYQNVLSVAASNQTDLRAGFSNFNFAVGVSAPGQSIMSSIWNRTYQAYSGTSMAAPVVSGMAALLKSQHPNYSPMQLKALIQNTADPVYNVGTNANPMYWGRLGSGRVNILKSLTQNPPGLSYLNMQATNRRNRPVASGDTVYINFNFINYLASISPAATLSISTNNPNISIIQPTYAIGALATNNTKQQPETQSFVLKLGNNLDDNALLAIQIILNDNNAQQQILYARFRANTSYIDLNVNNIATTISSHGRLAFADDNNRLGLGFRFKNGFNMAYEIGLMAGTSAAQLVSTTRSTAGVRQNDFLNRQSARFRTPLVANTEVAGMYDDYDAAQSIGLQITHNTYAYTQTAADSNYIIYQMQLFSETDINGLYVGFYADWDISENSGSDSAGYSDTERLGYAYNVAGERVYGGVAALGTVPHHCLAICNDGFNSPFGVFDGFSKSEKFQSLSSGTANARAGRPGGEDISHVVSVGPVNLLAGQLVVVGFAFVGGKNLNQIRAAAAAAQARYAAGLPIITSACMKEKNIQSPYSIWPNPSTGKIYIDNLDNKKNNSVQIYNLTGKLVFSTIINQANMPLELGVPAGMYLLRLNNGKMQKIIIGK